MLFVAILSHTPESCWMRPENAKVLKEVMEAGEKLEETAKKAGVKIIGAYANMNEHTMFYILETDNYAGVSKILGGPLLTHNTAKITPVTTIKEAMAMVR